MQTKTVSQSDTGSGDKAWLPLVCQYDMISVLQMSSTRLHCATRCAASEEEEKVIRDMNVFSIANEQKQPGSKNFL